MFIERALSSQADHKMLKNMTSRGGGGGEAYSKVAVEADAVRVELCWLT